MMKKKTSTDFCEMNFSEFQKLMNASRQEVAREVYRENQDIIHIKKEKTAVKNFGKIFDAVFKISSTRGFQAMSLRDLSSETGMSMGALYRYFASKEELLEIILKQGQSMIARVLAKSVEAHDEPEKKLRAVVKAHLFLSEAAREWFYFTFMEAPHVNKKVLEEIQSMEAYTEKILVDILKRGQKEGAFVKRDPLMTASMIKALQQDWYLKRWKYAGRNISVDQYAEFVLEFIESFCVPADANPG